MKKKKIKKTIMIIENILLIIISLGAIATICYGLIKPDSFFEALDNGIYKVLNVHIFGDTNKRINNNKVIPIAKNKDYSNSIMYIYYELLNDNSKNTYNKVIKAITDYEDDVSIPNELNVDEIKDIYHAILYDHPEIFWVDINFNIAKNANETKIEFVYTIEKDKIEDTKKIINEEINKIYNEAKNIELDYEKELYVHDKLSDLANYDSTLYNDQSIYNIFINKRTVCTGYAKAFQLIMTKLGIPTYSITGYSNENHVWNIVELEDGFYNVDLTWDDQYEQRIYKYFNINDEMIETDHKKDAISSKIKYNNGSKYTNTYSSLYEEWNKKNK